MRFKIAKLAPFLVGILIAPSLYLNIAMGEGRVPWVTLDYSMLIALAVIPLSFFSSKKDFSLSSMSFLIGVLCLVSILVSLFLIGFAAGLPGTEWTTESVASANAAFIIAAIMSIRNYKALKFIIVGFAVSIIFTFVSVHTITKYKVNNEIQKTLLSGGCVFLKSSGYGIKPFSQKAIYNVQDISLGLIIGSSSPRIQFVTRNGSSEWTYGKMKTTPLKGKDKECINKNKPK